MDDACLAKLKAEETWKRMAIEMILELTPRVDGQRIIGQFFTKPLMSGAGPSGYSPARSIPRRRRRPRVHRSLRRYRFRRRDA